MVNTFYRGATRRRINDRPGHYYATINTRAAQIHNHQEKQKFLQSLYENFYKAYNPKGADRLGIVYIANLNIEYTYKQKMGRYEPFDHIVFVDTLDNMGFKYEAKQLDFFHSYDFREYKERVIDLLGRVCNFGHTWLHGAASVPLRDAGASRLRSDRDRRNEGNFNHRGNYKLRSFVSSVWLFIVVVNRS